jgi:thiamine biosynthesis lipoprotein
MATRFEIVLWGNDPVSLRAAGEEALNEIERLENQLSLFRPTSEIAHLNAGASRKPVRVTPAVFELLQQAKRLTVETEGAFDITIAPLVRCWGFMQGAGHVPQPEDLAAARSKIGMQFVHLDPDEFSVRFEREGMMIDLGAIGKGYAIDRAVELLREAGVSSALMHGGTSTVYGLGHPPEADCWKIEIPNPGNQKALSFTSSLHNAVEMVSDKENPVAEPDSQSTPFATVPLRDASLSVSAVWGKYFQSGGTSFGHIIDPRTGEPTTNAVLSAVVLPSATESDALSTALLTLGPAGHDSITDLRTGIQTLVVAERNGVFELKSKGIPFRCIS